MNVTLLCDGPSDKSLMLIIEWSIRQLRPRELVEITLADPSKLDRKRAGSLPLS